MIRRDITAPNGTLYLRRWYLVGKPQPKDGSWKPVGPELYLHKICQSDDPARGLHNHPWRWAISLILWRGYREVRLVGPDTQRVTKRLRRFFPLQINFLRGDDYHRVELIDGKPAWTLFLVGPRVKGWGFLTKRGYEARRP